MQALVNQVYTTMFAARLGTLSITALAKPNALLLVGPEATVDMVVKNLVEPLDKPLSPQSSFEVFQLKHLNATTAATTVNTFLGQGTTAPTPATALDVSGIGVQALRREHLSWPKRRPIR